MRQSGRSRAAVLAAISTVVAVACHSAAPAPVMTVSAPRLPPLVSAPIPRVPEPPATGLLSAPDTAREEHVQVDTHGREIDVRQILDFLAGRAGVRLVYSPEINQKVRLTLVDVPLSQAIEVVLSTANLTLENANGAPTQQPMPGVVFYELPVNVDSLSVDAIVKRFGVSREVAELLVQARTPRP